MKLKNLCQSNSHVLSANVALIPDKCYINDGWEQISCMPKALDFKIRSQERDQNIDKTLVLVFFIIFNMMKILIIVFIIKLMYVINVMLELMYSFICVTKKHV